MRVIVNSGVGRHFQTGADVVEIATGDLGFERCRKSVLDWDMGSGSSDANAAVVARSSNAFHSWAATSDAHLRPRPIAATESGSADASKPFETSITTGVVAREHAADPHLHAGDVMVRQRQQPPAGTAESRVRFRSAPAQVRHRQRRAPRHARRPRCRNHQRDIVVDPRNLRQSGCQQSLSRALKASTAATLHRRPASPPARAAGPRPPGRPGRRGSAG